MEKIEVLKRIILRLIGENGLLLSVIESIKQLDGRLPTIDLAVSCNSYYISDRNAIEIGLKDITECYNISKRFGCDVEYQFNVNNHNYDFKEVYERCNITINTPDHEYESIKTFLNESDFLNDKESSSDIIAVYSLAYSLYHEFGHVLHDKYNSNIIRRERTADTFAFELMKSLRSKEYENTLLEGIFVGIVNILYKEGLNNENKNASHPHGIERLYSLLDFWEIQVDSCYWEHAYRILRIWCRKNCITIDWEKNTSNTYKEKLFDAYIHFKKDPQ